MTDPVAILGQGVMTLVTTLSEKMETDLLEKSALGQLSERQKDLFTLLSARDWRDDNPSLNSNAKKLLKSRSPTKQWNLVRDWSRQWRGLISERGCIQFLSEAFASVENPGGYTLFMFSPYCKLHHGVRDHKRAVKGTFGKAELDDETVNYYASLDYYVPRSVADSETMLDMTVTFLESITGRRSIATDCYAYGLDLINKHRRRMEEAQEDDKLFMMKYLHLLDVVFNNFCQDLADHHTRRNPIRAAKPTLKGRCVQSIDRVMSDLEHEIVPNLRAPVVLTRPNHEEPAYPEARNVAPTGNGGRRKESPEEQGNDRPEWWTKNPSTNPAWLPPSGKPMQEFFNTSDKGRANLALVQIKMPHHNPTIKKNKNVCLKYILEGACRPNCFLAHVPFDRYKPDEVQRMDAAFKKAYT
jgi:hypothetical protein